MTAPSTLNTAPRRFGLVAGWGRFPVVIAEALKRQGMEVYCMGVKDHADEAALSAVCDDFCSVGVSKLGRQIGYFRRCGVTHATMAGKVFKVRLFERLVWLKHLPDWTCVRTFFPHFITKTKDRSDDAMLTAVVEAYARGGVTLVAAVDYAPELLVKTGHLGGPQASWAQKKDIQFGWRLAKEMGRLDVGAKRGGPRASSAGGRSRRRHRRMHPPGGRTLPGRRLHGRQSR